MTVSEKCYKNDREVSRVIRPPFIDLEKGRLQISNQHPSIFVGIWEGRATGCIASFELRDEIPRHVGLNQMTYVGDRWVGGRS